MCIYFTDNFGSINRSNLEKVQQIYFVNLRNQNQKRFIITVIYIENLQRKSNKINPYIESSSW